LEPDARPEAKKRNKAFTCTPVGTLNVYSVLFADVGVAAFTSFTDVGHRNSSPSCEKDVHCADPLVFIEPMRLLSV
jgi:hypothetical protein